MLKKYEIDSKEGIRQMYDDFPEFAEYVAAFAKQYGISIDTALEQAIVRERARDYITRY